MQECVASCSKKLRSSKEFIPSKTQETGGRLAGWPGVAVWPCGGWPWLGGRGRVAVAGWPWPRGRVAGWPWPGGRGRVAVAVAGPWPWPGRGRDGRQLKKAIVPMLRLQGVRLFRSVSYHVPIRKIKWFYLLGFWGVWGGLGLRVLECFFQCGNPNNNVHVPVHTQAQQPYHLSCCPADTGAAHSWSVTGGVGWGGAGHVHVPVHTQARQPHHLSCCPADTGTALSWYAGCPRNRNTT